MAKSRSWGRKLLSSLHLILWLSLLIILALAYTPVTRYLLGALTVPEEVREADLIVVLGGGVNQGRYLSLVSSHRMVRGVQLYFDGRAKKILFSGGMAGPATVSEAVVFQHEISLALVRPAGLCKRGVNNQQDGDSADTGNPHIFASL